METCTCHPTNWFAKAPHAEFILTIQCPIHGQGPDALAPTQATEPKVDFQPVNS
jgi:hypothetical protein